VDFSVLVLEDRGETLDRFSPQTVWRVPRNNRDLSESVRRQKDIGRIVDLEPLEFGVSGRVAKLRIHGQRGRLDLSGLAIRRVLGISDNRFTAEPHRDRDGSVTTWWFSGGGWGHGLGLCQAGAYGMVLCFGSLPFSLSVLLAGAGTGLLALVVGYPCLRVRGPYFVILTFGLAELVKYVVINIEAALGQFGRLLFGGPGLAQIFYVVLALAAASAAITYLVRRSRFGAGLRAIRENEEAAGTLGINVARFKVLAFALSAVIPGMVGAAMVLRTTYFEPLDLFNPITSFTIVSIAIIGGGDDVPGPVYGALFLVLLQELLWANWPEVYMILLGALLVAFVLGAPEGIHGRIAALRRRARGAPG